MLHIIFCLSALLLLTSERAYGFGAFRVENTEGNIVGCTMQAIEGKFAPNGATYNPLGTCSVDFSSNEKGKESTFDKVKRVSNISWTGQGTYNPANSATAESIELRQEFTDRPGYVANGSIGVSMTCEKDPWRFEAGFLCKNFQFHRSGTVDPLIFDYYQRRISPNAVIKMVIDGVEREFRGVGLPLTSLLSSAQRTAFNTQYQAFMASKQQYKPGLGQTTRDNPAVGRLYVPPSQAGNMASAISRPPTIISPTPGQRFFHLQIVPIRLAPPKGFTPTGYEINIQRYANGNWINHHSFPGSAAVMQSATGYTDFGPGGKGPSKKTVLLTSPGAWRLQAQASLPTPLGWGDWIPFTVDASTVGQAATGGVKGAPLSR